ncbi:hypothetical protein OG21DRAFT_1075395 [Imleria badia]|nr:hypothetical protein OG21DRAFT_1075395 [Imleria badia]
MADNDEASLQEVEVDQRALVNILSRYPGEFDVLRELIQNADDAEAPCVEVHFESCEAEQCRSASERNDISKLNIRKWTIKNKGIFKEKDWERLGKIAHGNDNCEKVGAFGVGFYSVLSKSDRPIVKSNGQSLQFSRGTDGRLRKRFVDRSPDSSTSPDTSASLDSWTSPDLWTSVELELQDPEPLPGFADLTRFLVSSVAFLMNVHTISIYLDGNRQPLLHIQKEIICKEPIPIPIPQHLMPTTASETLTVESIQRTVQKITIDAAELAFTSSSTSSSSHDHSDDILVECSLRSRRDSVVPASLSSEVTLQENAIMHDLYTATTCVNLHPDSEMSRGVKSSMKSLPSSFKCKALYFNTDQYDSLASVKNLSSNKAKHLARLLFGSQGIVPENDSGRLFIGQTTNQTTGIGLHISAHFLPTMERGSIDLANGQVAAWNNEVLWVGGFLARIIYEEEMRVAESMGELATQRGLRTMARFAFGSTVPHSGVSQILQDAFFFCCHKPKSPFLVVSDIGISDASDAQFRQRNKDLSFLKKYLVLHEGVEPGQNSQIVKRYDIPLFKYQDIVSEFETGVTQDVMKLFFAWWEETKKNLLSSESKAAGEKFCQKFASRAVLRSSNGVKIALKNIEYFTLFPLPDDLSPPDNIYIDVTSGVPSRDAVECFGWSQLPLLVWLTYACDQARQLGPNGDPDLGRRISRVLVQFALVEELTLPQWDHIADLMKDIDCIPTNMGLRLPADSYFGEADILGNLPVVKEGDFLDIPVTYVAETGFRYRPVIVNPENVRMVLMLLRVRRMMEWKEMVERLETAASEGSNERLLRFLAIVLQGKLTDERLDDLKKKSVFYSQNHGRVSATELHLPNEDIRKLGLPILALPRNGIASLQSTVDPLFEMEPFVEFLGIQRSPTLAKIIAQAGSSEPEVQRSALRYLLSNLETLYNAYKPDDFANVAFIPTKCGSLARPNEVFASPMWEKLGFKQASEALCRDLSRLGVKDDPSVDTIIEYLKTPNHTLPDLNTATTWFEHLFLHGRVPIPTLREQFSTIPFVPVKSLGPSSSEPTPIEYFPPKECFIKSSNTKEHYHNIFPFVDFSRDGSNHGNKFLEYCCAKESPDASDVVRKIVQDPQRYLRALGNDPQLYLEDLRTIASGLDSLSEDDKRAMQEARMFLAWRERDGHEELLPAHQVIIRDWENHDFGRNVFLAPKDDKDNVIEKMYHKMGSQFLGTYVRYEIKPLGHDDKYNLPLNRNQLVRRIICFMRQRDNSEKADVSFYNDDSSVDFRVRACKSLTMRKKFAPPPGVLADGVDPKYKETDPVHVKAGFEVESCTLWVVKGSCESVDMRNDIAVALCRVLLKTFGPNDMLLLSSLIATDDKSLEGYFGGGIKSDLPSAPAVKAKSRKKTTVKFPLPPFLVSVVGVLSPKHLRFSGQKTIPPEEDMLKAIGSWGGSNPNGQSPDFSAPCQPNPPSFKKHNSHCKQARTIMLQEKTNLQDESTRIKFFLAQDAECQQPPLPALQKFARLISDLTLVFGQEASNACYMFWKDTDDDLMAFNRDQKYIFFNLAHYYKFFYTKDVEEKKVIIEWFLIMAHEIAHNVILDHDEYHGSLSSRLAVTYFPDLQKRFKCIAGDAQLPQST